MLTDLSVYSNMSEQNVQGLSNPNLLYKLLQHKKTVVLTFILLLFATVVLGSTVFFLHVLIAKLVQVCGFIALGYIHMTMVQKVIIDFSKTGRLMYAVLMAAVVILLLSLLYLFFPPYRFQTVIAAGCAFLLPTVLEMVWLLFHSISASDVSLWYFSEELPLQKSTTFLNSIPIRFLVKLEDKNKAAQSISFRVPVRMKLGMVFYHTIQEHNNHTSTPIGLTNENGIPHGWLFYTTGFLGWSRYLDPERTLVENGIKQNSLIVARCQLA